MIFAEDICYKERAGKKHISKGHLDSECVDKEEHLDVGKNGCQYAESKKAILAEESVE